MSIIIDWLFSAQTSPSTHASWFPFTGPRSHAPTKNLQHAKALPVCSSRMPRTHGYCTQRETDGQAVLSSASTGQASRLVGRPLARPKHPCQLPSLSSGPSPGTYCSPVTSPMHAHCASVIFCRTSLLQVTFSTPSHPQLASTLTSFTLCVSFLHLIHLCHVHP